MIGDKPLTLCDKELLFWEDKHPFSTHYNMLRDRLVPESGIALTLAGEVLRCAANVYYRHCNDGDEFVGDGFDFLNSHIGTFKSYDEMVMKAISFAAKPENQKIKNETDYYALMRIYREFDAHDYDVGGYSMYKDSGDGVYLSGNTGKYRRSSW